MSAFPTTLGGAKPVNPDRQATALDELCHKLDMLANDYIESLTRIEQCNNRATGPNPEASKTAPTPEPSGIISLLDLKISRLNDISCCFRAEASRLERVL
jgi:hypothetical protein